MAVVTHVVIRGLTPDKYDEVRKRANWLEVPPDGGLAHVAWFDGDDCHAFNVWESEEAFGRFGAERLGPAMAAAGVEAAPEVTFDAPHEVFFPRAVTLT